MKVIILAGGLGSRLAEETSARPKPMVEIGGRPILWHIMKIYSHYGINDFIICLGYKGYMIKEFFANYFLHSADVTIDLQQNKIETHSAHCEPWRVTLIDTGAATMTGGRLMRALPYVEKDEEFCFTYGDGLADINLDELLTFHRSHKTLVTLTATNRLENSARSKSPTTPGHFVFRKTQGRWTLGQRRILRALTQNRTLHPGGFHHLGACSPRNSQRRAASLRLQTSRLLAAHGYAA